MIRVLAALISAIFLLVQPAQAQQNPQGVWVQIEAHSNLRTAQERAQIYSNTLADVAGFALGAGWYGIVLGPYAPEDAEQVLRVYRRERQIPRDSFIARPNALRQQFWPVGANVLNRGEVVPPVAQAVDPAPQEEPRVALTEPADETPARRGAANAH